MALITRYVNTASTAGGDGTTNLTTGSTRAYASISEAEAAEQKDFVTATDSLLLLCDKAGGNDTTAVDLVGSTTNATYNIEVRAASNSRHAGVIGAGYKIHTTGATTSLFVRQAGTVIDGIEVENTTGNYGIYVLGAVDSKVKNCISKSTTYAYSTATTSILSLYINCIAYDTPYGFFVTPNIGFIAENCAAFDCTTYGFYQSANGTTNFPILRNTATFGCATPYGLGSSALRWDQTNSTNNSTDATVTTDVPGVSAIANIVGTAGVDFVDQATNNWNIPNTSTLFAAGVDRSTAWGTYGVALDDITDTLRANWSIGPFDGPISGGFSGKIMGVLGANVGKIMGVSVANIAKIQGVTV